MRLRGAGSPRGVRQAIMLDLQVVAGLEVEPEPQLVLGDAERLQVLVQQHLTRVDRRHARGVVHDFLLHVVLVDSVVVDDLDVLRSGAGPAKADPPLPVDTDAVLVATIAPKLLESVSRRHPPHGAGRRGRSPRSR